MAVDTETLTSIYHVAHEAVERASQVIVEAREARSFDVQRKSSRDLVTSADLAAERVILDTIRARFPDHKIFSEETCAVPPPELFAGPLWIVDPIDGTTNFAQGHFQVAVSVAFAFDGDVQVGVVGAPFQGETFAARRGLGAVRNGKTIAVSETSKLADALIATGFPYNRDTVPELAERVRRVLVACRDIRRIGSAALDLCWVACGRFDGYYETVMPWDMAAGALIAREAGACVGRYSEMKSDLPAELDGNELLVTNRELYESLRTLLIGASE